MFRQLFNWRTWLAVIAILIVSGTIFYSSYLANKIEREEKQKVEEWVQASISLLNPASTDPNLAFKIMQDVDDIPIIGVDERGMILEFKNLDSIKIKRDTSYLYRALQKFKSQNSPIVYTDPLDSTKINRYYYGHSKLLTE